MGFLDYDVEIHRSSVRPTRGSSPQLPLPTRRASQRTLPDRTSWLKCLYLVTCSLDRPDAARHAGSPDASMTHRDHLRRVADGVRWARGFGAAGRREWTGAPPRVS
nr:hypothetical protein [uncultured bacterium]